jgi:DNA topoisomerase-2
MNKILGIGTGWSSSIPSFNPEDLAAALIAKMEGAAYPDLVPWYFGFTGTIEKIESTGKTDTFMCYGEYSAKDRKIAVTEIPICTSIDSYYSFLKTLQADKVITGLANNSGADTPKFTFTIVDSDFEPSYDSLNLVSKITTSNMVMFVENKGLRKFSSVYEILDEFYDTRLRYYALRKAYLTRSLKEKIEFKTSIRDFLMDVMEGRIKLFMVPEDKVVEAIEKKGYVRVDGSYQHLMSIPIKRFVAESVESADKEIEALTEELTVIESTTEKDTWTAEIGEFLDAYARWKERILSE